MNVAVILARMNSARLYGKPLLKLRNQTLIEMCVERLKYSTRIKNFVIATTRNSKDDAIANFCREMRWPVYRGSEKNVAERFLEAARLMGGENIVRINSDSPLLDPCLIDAALGVMETTNAELISNVYDRSFPYGISIETVREAYLSREISNMSAESKEHIFTHFYDPKRWRESRGVNIKLSSDYSSARVVVDNLKDLHFMRQMGDMLSRFKVPYRFSLAATLKAYEEIIS